MNPAVLPHNVSESDIPETASRKHILSPPPAALETADHGSGTFTAKSMGKRGLRSEKDNLFFSCTFSFGLYISCFISGSCGKACQPQYNVIP